MPDVLLDIDDYGISLREFLRDRFGDLSYLKVYKPRGDSKGYRLHYNNSDPSNEYLLYDDGSGFTAVYSNFDADDNEVVLCVCPGKFRNLPGYTTYVFDTEQDRHVHKYTKVELKNLFRGWLQDDGYNLDTIDWTSAINNVLYHAYEELVQFEYASDVIFSMRDKEIYPFWNISEYPSLVAHHKGVKWLN